METLFLQAVLWMGLALISILLSLRIATLFALIEILVNALAGNLFRLSLTPWVN